MRLFSWNVNGVRAIEKKGFIKILSGASRGIVLSEEEEKGIPVIGLVAAGGPILAQENIEKRNLSDKLGTNYQLEDNGLSIRLNQAGIFPIIIASNILPFLSYAIENTFGQSKLIINIISLLNCSDFISSIVQACCRTSVSCPR